MKNEKLVKFLEFAEKRRELEINLLWQRSLMFSGIALAAFVGYEHFFNQSEFVLALLVAAFGFVASVIWVLANWGSKYWQETWETKTAKFQACYQEEYAKEFGKIEDAQKDKGLFSAERFSPSRLIIALSVYVAAAWLVIIFATLFIIRFGFHYRLVAPFSMIAVFLSILYTIGVYFATKPSPVQKQEKCPFRKTRE